MFRIKRVLIAILLSAPPSLACTIQQSPDMRFALRADLVFVGEVKAHKQVQLSENARHGVPVLVVTITETLSGPEKPTIDLVVPNASLARVVALLPIGTNVVAAASDYVALGWRRLDTENPTFALSCMCGCDLFFHADTEKGRGLRSMFDGEGDPEIEASLLNTLFGFDQVLY